MLNKYVMFLEEISTEIDVGSPVDIIYLDFQKAFDKVTHQRLLLKLKAHGIGDSITDWVEQWLTDRRQRVVVDVVNLRMTQNCLERLILMVINNIYKMI